MRLLAPAKINLFLRVGPLGVGRGSADGFHPLVSWMCTVGLFDTLILESRPAGAGCGRWLHFRPHWWSRGQGSVCNAVIDVRSNEAEDWRVSLHCDDPELPTDGRNLVVRAGQLLSQEVLAAETLAV